MKFKKIINGKLRSIKHYSRHRANARQIALIIYTEHLQKEGGQMNKENKKTFITAFNMGYNHGRKRHLALERKKDGVYKK